MKIPRVILRLTAATFALVSAGTLEAQGVTTAAISGTVTAQDGRVVEAANIIVVNTTTGARAAAQTRGDGRYFVQNLEIGGPYTVSMRRIGFAPVDSTNIMLSLGQNRRVDFRIEERARQLEGVMIIGETGSAISPSRTGTSITLSDSSIARLPTLNRNFTDFVGLTPQISTKGPGNSGGGQNNRFNAIQIDGSVASDLFGLGSTNQPGAQAGAKQISLEAVKEYQVLLAPFDVRQGNFTGFLLNAVTKSGSNEFHGSFTYATRNQTMQRDKDFIRASPFTQSQYGFWVGGPILKDKLFFSVAPEFQKQEAPAAGPFIGAGSPTPSPVNQSGVDSLVNILTTQYGFPNPGGTGKVENENPLANLFVRLDANLPANHRLVARLNYVNAQQDIFSRSSTRLNLSNNGYNFRSITNSGLVQLFSNFAQGSSNELLLGYTTVRDKRVIPLNAPFVVISRIQDSLETGALGTGQVSAGTENSSQGNELDQDIIELTNNFTMPFGNHRVTVGTKNEFFKVRNLFAQNSFGNFTFGTLDSLIANNPSTATLGLKLDAADGAARFKARTLGFYVQDEWNVTRDLNLTMGLRLDMPGLTDSPNLNTNIQTNLNINTTEVPKNIKQWSPRFGFNWDVTGDQVNQLRGGSGVFVGRPAYVWLSNVFGNSGVNGFANLACNGMAAAPPMPNAGQPIPANCEGTPGTPAVNVNTVDPDLRFPAVWRSSIAFDRRLPWNMIGTIEGMYTRAVAQFYYQNIGLQDDPVGFDRNGRALYGTRSGTTNNLNATFKTGVTNVFHLQNAEKEHDYSYNVTGQLQKRFSDAFEGMAAYTYGRSYSVWDLTSSVAQSNWQFGRSYAGRQDAEELRPSKFDAPHRIVAGMTYSFPFKLDVSVTHFAESGTPFEFVYATDVNADGFNSNDLIYVPTDARDVNQIRFSQLGGFSPAAQADSLEAYINARPCLDSQRGTIMKRNSCRTPWTRSVNLSARKSISTFRGQNAILQIDAFNFLNLLNKRWGAQSLGSTNSPLLLTRTGFFGGPAIAATDANGAPVAGGGAEGIYTFNAPNFATQFNTRNVQSNYALQVQIKYTF
jgi:hypothetical protein